MDIRTIAARIAGYDFRTKMKVNALVLEELGRATGKDMNTVAEDIADSPLHDAIQALADAIEAEAQRLKSGETKAA